jgi:hypothetical protein
LHRKIRIKPDSAPAHEFPVRDLLVGEFRNGERQYVLGDGELLEVKADFLQRLDTAVSAVPRSTFRFPTYQGGTEPDYVRTAAARSGDRLVMLDDTPIIAAEMFLQHAPARDVLLTRIPDRAKSSAMEDAALAVTAALERRSPDSVIITLLLLGPWHQRDLTTLPLVSRVRLRRAAARVTNLGYRFEVAAPVTERP